MAALLQIENASFDGAFVAYEGIGELSVADGWTPWWRQGTEDEVSQGFSKRPEFKAEPNRVRSGQTGQKFFTTFATHSAVLYQKVQALHGWKLTLSAFVQVYSVDADGETQGGYGCQIGIDPYGGTDPFSEKIVWGDWASQYDNWDGDSWRQVIVQAEAVADVVTIFLKGQCDHRVKHNDSYWDDVVLTADIEPTPSPTPTPTPSSGTIGELKAGIEALRVGLETVLADVGAIEDHIQTMIDNSIRCIPIDELPEWEE